MQKKGFAMLLPLLVLAMAASLVGGSTSAKADTSITTYTFAQAVTAGIINASHFGCVSGTTCSPPSGYSFCSSDTQPAGYTDPDALQTAVAAAPESSNCVVDPRTMNTVVGPTEPDEAGTSDNLAWQQSWNSTAIDETQGWRFGIEGGSPSGNTNDQVWARIKTFSENGNGQTDELGWYWSPSVNSGVNQVYYRVGANKQQYAPGYHIYQGYYYGFRIRGYFNGANAGSAIDFLKTDGTWATIMMDPNMPCDVTKCAATVGTAVKCQDSNNCPTLNAPTDGSGINYHNGQYRYAPNSWADWTTSGVPHTQQQYYGAYCYWGISAYTAFRTPRQSC